MSSSNTDIGFVTSSLTTQIAVTLVIIFINTVVLVAVCKRRSAQIARSSVFLDSQCLTLSMNKFLHDIERERPMRFTYQQLRVATQNFSNLLGSGGFGEVYKGIFSDGTKVAVKVLSRSSDKRLEEQFMAEVSTIGRLHHFNLVRLYGFCFEKNLRALVYEYIANGSLDKYLFSEVKILEFEKLHEIAVGIAKGLAYLHEECEQQIIHCDIKPGNVLLDEKFVPKIADFGLAMLFNRDKSHITMTEGRGTPGYAAPELWMPYPVTRKCDVYSFGMLLFEIVGRRKNFDTSSAESQEWLPKWFWMKCESGDVEDIMLLSGISEKDRGTAERMTKVALWCVQNMPENRPMMSNVVKMLEGTLGIPIPRNPFPHMFSGLASPVLPAHETRINMDSGSSEVISTAATFMQGNPITSKSDIEISSPR